MMGVVRPSRGTFQMTFSPCGDQEVTGAFSRDMPVCSGPRQLGQSAACENAVIVKKPWTTASRYVRRVINSFLVNAAPRQRRPQGATLRASIAMHHASSLHLETGQRP